LKHAKNEAFQQYAPCSFCGKPRRICSKQLQQ
jgi:hypothetical protein